MHTKVKVATYALKLRTKLKELQAERKRKLIEYSDQCNRWRSQMVTWLRENGTNRINSIRIEKKRGRYIGSNDFNTTAFFDGAPDIPAYPTDEQIRSIQGVLKHLAITGQTTVMLSTDEVQKYLGDGKDDD